MSVMITKTIIFELISWVEKNLDNQLNIDIVAKKSGYSKWHLQRLFKAITGESLGSYILKRRLYKTAIALWFSGQKAYEVAVRYQFDSHQSFSRSFKSHFSVTPGAWRKTENLELNRLFPPFTPATDDVPELILEKIEGYDIFIQNDAGSLTIEEEENSNKFYNDVNHSVNILLNRNIHQPIDTYVTISNQYLRKTDNLAVRVHLGHHSSNCVRTSKINVKGNYLVFRWYGASQDLSKKVQQIYDSVLIGSSYVLRPDPDVIIIRNFDVSIHSQDTHWNYEYLIPVV
ncbi:RobA [Xenorhabdus mauleonii]|uniref:AraC family transcriptional regulator, mar-sox-rob regulon activator n=1 Tax=Xenorhabdus mauleonii TaxID=351675 RepID=A0A1I3LXP5_9GAMM|nr:helix-turn-helix domain-containing protein [Xenorhabdus mauleonii]PHM45335.1 RobA [Xenorhabdus mauleonii]SFI89539.1 AraC family transcriptional regulator, mar-sox-rob regulon activator [Xenorhabdus mauleonii]